MNKIIGIRGLTFNYKGQEEPAISELNCEIPCDGIVAIIGKSGSGKSTLLRLVSGVYRKSDGWSGCYRGNIHVLGHEPQKLRGPGQVSLMAQRPFLMNNLTVEENILLSSDLTPKNIEASNLNCNNLLKILELSEQKHQKPMELSGGMKTRVAFARAMVSRPKFLYLDEPFTSLDILMRWSMYKAIREERGNGNFTTLLTTHDIWEALILANWIVILETKDNQTSVSFHKNAVPEIQSCSIKECLRSIQPSVEKMISLLEISQDKLGIRVNTDRHSL